MSPVSGYLAVQTQKAQAYGQIQGDWQLTETAGMEITGMWIRAEVSEQMCGSLEKEYRERQIIFWHSGKFLDLVHHIESKVMCTWQKI